MAAEYFCYLWSDFDILKIDIFWKPGLTRVQKYFYNFDICHIHKMAEFRDLAVRHLEKKFHKIQQDTSHISESNDLTRFDFNPINSDHKWLSGNFLKISIKNVSFRISQTPSLPHAM